MSVLHSMHEQERAREREREGAHDELAELRDAGILLCGCGGSGCGGGVGGGWRGDAEEGRDDMLAQEGEVWMARGGGRAAATRESRDRVSCQTRLWDGGQRGRREELLRTFKAVVAVGRHAGRVLEARVRSRRRARRGDAEGREGRRPRLVDRGGGEDDRGRHGRVLRVRRGATGRVAEADEGSWADRRGGRRGG